MQRFSGWGIAMLKEKPTAQYVLAADFDRIYAAAVKACSDMGCFCDEEAPDEKCPMCELEAVLRG